MASTKVGGSPPEEDEEKKPPQKKRTRAEWEKSVVEGIMASEQGRAFVRMVLAHASIFESPIERYQSMPAEKRLLQPDQFLFYKAGQQEVSRWLLAMLATYTPAQLREMNVEAYVRREHADYGEAP